LATPVDSTGTHHATPNVETFELVIGLATSRVLARLPPGSVQPAETAEAAADLTEQAAATVLELLLLQPPAARLAATTRIMPATAGGLAKHLIGLISCRVRLRRLPRAPRRGSYQRKIDINMIGTCYRGRQARETAFTRRRAISSMASGRWRLLLIPRPRLSSFP
jgi:hypothetical protein